MQIILTFCRKINKIKKGDFMQEKSKVNFVFSLKFICFQMRTVLTQCLQQAISDYILSDLGEDGYKILVEQMGGLLDDEEDIFFCDINTLLGILVSKTDCAYKIAEFYHADKEKLSECAASLLNRFNDPSFETEQDLDHGTFRDCINNILSLAEFFIKVKENGKVLYYLTLVKLYSVIEKKENFAPVYSISKTITEEKFDIDYAGFIICSRNAGAIILTEDNELCFSTNDKQVVLDEVKNFISTSGSKKGKDEKRVKFIKIAAICLAAIIAITSAWISSSITKKIIGVNNNGATTSNNTTSTSSSNGGFSSFFSSDNTSSEEESQYQTSVESVTNSNGRVTNTYSIMNRYTPGDVFTTDYYKEHNGDVSQQKVVFVNLKSLTFSEETGGNISIRVENNTEYLIRNISFEVRLYSESGDYIVGLKTDKLMANENATLSLAANVSEDVNHDIAVEAWELPGVDLGFVRTDIIVSYDIIK